MGTAGTWLTTPINGSADWTSWITKVDLYAKGMMSLSLTNYDTTSIPQIAAGSICENDGSFAQFAEDTDIDGLAAAADGTTYVKIVNSSSTPKPTATTSAPTWSDAKQGWYSGTERYVAKLTKAAPNYTNKAIYIPSPNGQIVGPVTIEGNLTVNGAGGLIVKSGEPITLDGLAIRTARISIGNWDMDATASVAIASGLGLADISKVLSVDAMIVIDDSSNVRSIFSGGAALYQSDNNITLQRTASGVFDSASFDTAVFNRGYIHVIYIE